MHLYQVQERLQIINDQLEAISLKMTPFFSAGLLERQVMGRLTYTNSNIHISSRN